MVDVEDVKQLIWHYSNLRDDTTLLIEYCGLMHRSLKDGYRDVLGQLELLREQQSLLEKPTGGEKKSA